MNTAASEKSKSCVNSRTPWRLVTHADTSRTPGAEPRGRSKADARRRLTRFQPSETPVAADIAARSGHPGEENHPLALTEQERKRVESQPGRAGPSQTPADHHSVKQHFQDPDELASKKRPSVCGATVQLSKRKSTPLSSLPDRRPTGRTVRCNERLGGLLRYYSRSP